MKNAKIGVFDSGLGGLTAVKQLQKLMPYEDIVYFGDTGRVPYGTRSEKTIISYAMQDMAFLKSHDLKAIVVACGTVSSVALPAITQNETLPVIGVVEPTSKTALNTTKNGKIGVIGTSGTIKSASYEKAINKFCSATKVYGKACPLFVPLVENGRFNKHDEVTKIVVREYLEEFLAKEVDTLILGCTHYPLLSDIISDFFDGKVQLIDSGAAAATDLYNILTQKDMLKTTGVPQTSFYVSDSPETFGQYGSIFLGQNIDKEVTQIDISKY